MRGHFLFTLTSYAMMCTFFVPDNRDLALKQRQTAVIDSVFLAATGSQSVKECVFFDRIVSKEQKHNI